MADKDTQKPRPADSEELAPTLGPVPSVVTPEVYEWAQKTMPEDQFQSYKWAFDERLADFKKLSKSKQTEAAAPIDTAGTEEAPATDASNKKK